ncbi:structural cement protein Gp24 [Labrys neptuniae]
MSFQKQVYMTQAPAVAGQLASVNPRHSALTVEGGFVAGPSGVTVGLFVWADATGRILSNTGTGLPTGVVARTEQALITTYLTEFGNTIPAGFAVGDVFSGVDIWVTNAGAGAVTVGQKGFAKLADGTISFAAAGATVAGSIETKFYAATAGAAGELVKMTDTI